MHEQFLHSTWVWRIRTISEDTPALDGLVGDLALCQVGGHHEDGIHAVHGLALAVSETPFIDERAVFSPWADKALATLWSLVEKGNRLREFYIGGKKQGILEILCLWNKPS